MISSYLTLVMIPGKTMHIKTFFLISIFLLPLCKGAFLQTLPANMTGNPEPMEKGTVMIWDSWSILSSVSLENLFPRTLRGKWTTDYINYTQDSLVYRMKLVTPIQVKFSRRKYKRAGEIYRYSLEGNTLLSWTKKSAQKDTAFINQVTATELTVTWKNGDQYIREYYTR